MDDDWDAVGGGVNVEFNPVCTETNGFGECLDRVFGVGIGGSAVGVDLHQMDSFR